jgi:hypothetical protein
MQLKAMHEHTAALPALDFTVPEGSAWGADTREAMLRGVYHGARGLAWRLIERYAEQYGGFPLVIATGGDAAALFSDDELVNQIVPDLVLRGIALAARSALEPDGDAESGAPGRAGAGAGFSLLPGQVEPKPHVGAARPITNRPAQGGRDHPHGHPQDHDCGPGCDHD